MTRPRKVGFVLATTTLLVSGALGVLNGVRELSYTLTLLQRTVSIGVLLYGVAGLAGALALMKRHRSAPWLGTLWGLAVTYVSSLAAMAYAGADATLAGAIGSGTGAALIAVGVIWVARRETARAAVIAGPTGVRAAAVTLVILSGAASLGACRQLYSGPPIVTDRPTFDGLVTKVVRAKREPDRLIAQDLTVCWVAPDVFPSIKAGDHWRCDWRRVPEGQ